MKAFFKRMLEKLSDAWYGMLPFLVLLGAPLALCVAIKWKDIPKIVGSLAEIGRGSWIFGILLVFFGSIGFLSICCAVINTVETIAKKLGNKWANIYIVITLLGFVALKIILERS